MSEYTRTVKTTASAGQPHCVFLPAFPYGVLRRLIVQQLSGTSGGGTIDIYDRKGACVGEIDLNVRAGGDVSSVADNAGQVQLTTAAPHGLRVGDQIEIKECSVAAYNGKHTVQQRISDTEVVTDVAFTVAAADGVWQTLPFIPSVTPEASLIYTGTLAGGSLAERQLELHYINRDNQNEDTRAPHTGLWAELTPDNAGDYELTVTTELCNPE